MKDLKYERNKEMKMKDFLIKIGIKIFHFLHFFIPSLLFLFGLVWFLRFNDISTFVGYLMPKPSL